MKEDYRECDDLLLIRAEHECQFKNKLMPIFKLNLDRAL